MLAEYKVDTASAIRDGIKKPDKVEILTVVLIEIFHYI